MRRLTPTAIRSLLTHSSQTLALGAVAVLAMAAAPSTTNVAGSEDLVVESEGLPEPAPVVAVAEPAGPVMREMAFGEPIPGRAINSRFGLRRLGGEAGPRMHKGVDIAAATGTRIVAPADAEVIRIGYDAGGYGNFVELRHPNGMTTLYGHMSRVDVRSRQVLKAGERVGLVGSTGYSTGPHLHFEVRRNGEQVNPARVIGRTFSVRADA